MWVEDYTGNLYNTNHFASIWKADYMHANWRYVIKAKTISGDEMSIWRFDDINERDRAFNRLKKALLKGR